MRIPIRSISRASPPSHFASGSIPPNYDQLHVSQASAPPPTQPTIVESKNGSSGERPLRELTSLIAMFALGYIAIDNYINRIKVEKLNKETTSIHLKALQIQQAKINDFKKKIDQAMILERRNVEKRSFKMSLHIALLRKQLEDNGIDPIKIDSAIKEFEKNVRLENSVRNSTGQSLWLDENSELRTRLPNIHDYDRKE
ncbi:hypothetical protein CLIB1444_18S01090 [[Candida] jaroonii]|uniref:Uncharacterized protein n=1 Tax=[Candida] jaroonii TaxID=467808 RepID=A0ACA9YF28_9ASCO|nr:hypothetical protein CLIB1444_18S01090 [[Candida] jaroonii]